eukprot:4647870-Amphidinium_carterae.1
MTFHVWGRHTAVTAGACLCPSSIEFLQQVRSTISNESSMPSTSSSHGHGVGRKSLRGLELRRSCTSHRCYAIVMLLS